MGQKTKPAVPRLAGTAGVAPTLAAGSQGIAPRAQEFPKKRRCSTVVSVKRGIIGVPPFAP